MATQVSLNSGAVSSAGSLKLQTNGTTDAVTIDTSQNVGLGVTPSAWGTSGAVFKALELGKVGNSIFGLSSGPELEMTSNAYYNNGWKYANTGTSALRFSLNGDTAGAFSWNIAGSGTAGNAITFTQAMTLDASGNLGVGTTSPTQKITTNGAIRTTGYSTNFNETGAQIDAYDGMRLCSYISTGSAIQFLTNASGGNTAERARIDSSGNLLVGTTSGVGTGSKLGVSATSIDALHIIANSSGNNNIVAYNSSGINCFIVANNGNTTNTNNSYGAISDIKLKENITDATPKLAQLNQVRVVNYNLIGDEHKQLGVIAQELEQVFPSMVEEMPDRDSEGNDLGTTTKSVKYSVFVPMLIKAIQEQQAIITQLQADVAALKGKA